MRFNKLVELFWPASLPASSTFKITRADCFMSFVLDDFLLRYWRTGDIFHRGSFNVVGILRQWRGPKG